jgi:hypothetical protein
MAYNHKKLREEIDNYSETVWATVAFAHECRWNETTKTIDKSVKVGIGRPMTRPDKKEVTPDIVIQRRPDEGTAAEIKHTFPPSGEIERRKEIFEQLKNYDVDLLGWWTDSKRIKCHDLVLLTHLSHATHAVDFLTRDLAGTAISTFARNLAIVGYYRSEQDQLYFTLKKEYGSLLDPQLSEKLRLSVPIAVRHLIMARQVRFYDSPPPIPYTLRLLWEQVFPDLAQGIERDKKKGFTPVPVTVENLTQTLQKFFGYEADATGNRGIPRSEWVANALRTLDLLRMAELGKAAGSYTIRYKAIHGDVLERLGRLCYNLQHKKLKGKARKSKPGIGQYPFSFMN